ncbi:hypothetical protein AB0F07_39225 [Streptomyces fructofermentans]|uniref:hypothetical protein n=1 Tax=Streptomyces fructofermentans TaxID=152141 RepID=UPI0033E91B18
MTSMPEPCDEDEQTPQDDLAEAKAEHAANRAKTRQSRKQIREIKRGRRTKAIARMTDKSKPAARVGLMAVGTSCFIGAGTQLMSGDSSNAAEWLSAGIGCWALAVARRRR